MSHLRVLIVEDEVLVAAELAWLVEDLGHQVVGEAATSGEALRLAKETRPDLALVDVHLYDGPTGVEVARRISAESGATVLFMTANQKRVPAGNSQASGFDLSIEAPGGSRSQRRFAEPSDQSAC